MFHAHDNHEGGASLRMSSELNNIDIACHKAKCLLEERGLGQGIFSPLLVLREALANAMFHGNGANATKMVHCDLSFQGDILTISVEDEGKGFPWRKLSFDLPGPEREGGRGVCIMQSYSRRMKFNDQGNRVSLDILCRGET